MLMCVLFVSKLLLSWINTGIKKIQNNNNEKFDILLIVYHYVSQ
jgi:hypothetical protein